jgi:hypothetical protein
MKKFIYIITLLFITTSFAKVLANNDSREYYLIKTYHCKSNTQLSAVDDYLKNVFLPDLHKAGIKKVGVFKPIDNDTVADKRIVVFIPFKKIEEFTDLENEADKQDPFTKSGNTYSDAAYNDAPFVRIETALLHAFKNMPKFKAPLLTGNVSDKIYELRSYEGASETLYRKKVHMFNEGGEIDIFKRLSFNAVFYAEVLSGSHMPNLMYMTSFNSKAERDEHWKNFSSDAAWKKISASPEYANTVSKSDIVLMHPTEYSDL